MIIVDQPKRMCTGLGPAYLSGFVMSILPTIGHGYKHLVPATPSLAGLPLCEELIHLEWPAVKVLMLLVTHLYLISRFSVCATLPKGPQGRLK